MATLATKLLNSLQISHWFFKVSFFTSVRHIECFHITSRRPCWCPKTQNKEMAPMLVSQVKPLGLAFYFYGNSFFCFSKPIWLTVTWKHSIGLIFTLNTVADPGEGVTVAAFLRLCLWFPVLSSTKFVTKRNIVLFILIRNCLVPLSFTISVSFVTFYSDNTGVSSYIQFLLFRKPSYILSFLFISDAFTVIICDNDPTLHIPIAYDVLTKIVFYWFRGYVREAKIESSLEENLLGI